MTLRARRQNSQAKAEVLEVLGSGCFLVSFFTVRCINRNGVHFLDVIAHKTFMHYSDLEVISTHKGKLEEDQTHVTSRLVRQLTIQQETN
ncbi:hypothetical protein OUZ56_002294 [Daphnia magna]|nr:hypothetical protein OUZ56_002294 [Daphnia magna]